MGYSHALPKIVSSIPRNSNPLDLFINTGVGLVLGSSTVCASVAMAVRLDLGPVALALRDYAK
jgi:hypothetical protein